MLRYINNNNGVALLVVMSILLLSIVVIGMIFFSLNAESEMTNDYASDIKALKVAEIGADLAVNQWISYINDRQASTENPLGNTLQVSDFLDNTLESARSDMVGKLRQEYNNDDIDISFTLPAGQLTEIKDVHYGEDHTLLIDIEGKYNDERYYYQVRLTYCLLGGAPTYKGSK